MAELLKPLETREVNENYTLFPEHTADPGYGDEYSALKADKMSLLLGDANPGTDVLTSAISQGQQRQYFDVLKNMEENSKLNQRNEIVRTMMINRPAGTPVSLEEINLVGALSDDELYREDANSIVEKKYADLFINKLVENEESAVAQEALDEDEDAALEEMDRASFPLQRIQSSEDVFQEIKKQYDDSSWASWTGDFLKSAVIPLYDTIKGRERIETPTASLFAGNNREEQISQLYSLPPSEFKQTLKDIVDELAKDNLNMALEFAQDVRSYSQSDKGLANIFTGVDSVGIVASGVKAVTSAGRLAKGLSSASKGITKSPRQIADIAADSGLNKQAAISQVTQDILNGDISGVTTISRISELGNRLPAFLSPTKVLSQEASKNLPRLDAEAMSRLRISITGNAESLLNKVILKGTLVDRVEVTQIAKQVTEEMDRVKDQFPSNTYHIIDQRIYPAEADKITNTAVLGVRFGDRNGAVFRSRDQAYNYARRYIGIKTDDYSVEQHGLGGYIIEVKKPLADVGDWRKTEIESDLASPDTFDGYISRKLRSPDYHLSQAQRQARGRVVHTSEYLSKVIDEAIQPFQGKSTEWYNELDSMFRSSRVNQKYYQDIGEFEADFFKKFKKVPSEDQVEAYFLYRQINELDYLIRDADKVKKYTAKGFSNFETVVVNKEGVPEKKVFIGRVVDQLPPTDRYYRINIVDGGKKPRPMTNQTMKFTNNKALIDNLLANGYKIVEHGDEPVYSIMKGYKQNSIKMRTLGYKEGGHFDPRYEHYISQGNIDDIDGAKIFKGDLNLATSPTQKQAKEVASLFDKARLLVKNSDPSAKKFIDDNLPISYGEFIKKVKAGDIRLDVPILPRRSGQSTTDTFKYDSMFPTFQDYRHSEYNPLADTTVRYGTERADTLLDVWTHEDGKIIKQSWEPLMSPMDALSSATKNMINVRVFEDYAMKSANDWVQEFGHMLDVPTETLKSNPRFYLQNPKYRSMVGTDKAESARMAMLSIFDQLDEYDVTRIVYRDKVLNKAFDKRKLGDTRDFDPKTLYTAKDIQTFMRAAAFYPKLGTWNIKQLFVQGSAVAQAAAISPKAAIPASRALFFTRRALMTDNPEVLKGMANRYSKLMGWEKDDWLQMVKSFKESGLASIGGDTAYLDSVSTTSVTKNTWGKVKSGPIGKVVGTNTVFFNEGELTARIMAYSTSWAEWKAANPGKKLDRFAESRILQRSKDMTSNMTRDSNAQWQKGWTGVATQFWGYQARVAEQLWDGGGFWKDGSKLTKGEKLRLMTMFGTLYGSGTVVSANTIFIPTTAMVREWMLEEGIEESAASDIIVDGMVSTLTKGILGADVDFSTYGPNGIPTLFDLMNEDKSWAEAMMGAGPSVIADMGSAVGNAAYMYGYVGSDLSGDDVMAVLRNFSSVENGVKITEGTRALLAGNAARYISRKGNYIGDVSGEEMLISGILGTQPGPVSDVFLQNKINKDSKKSDTADIRAYKDAAIRAVRALEAGDTDAAELYLKRRDALAILYDIPMSARARVATETFRDHPMSEFVVQETEKIRRKQQFKEK